jgi:hypothetical protein
MSDQVNVGSRVIVRDEKGWVVGVVDKIVGTGRCILRGQPGRVYGFYPLLTEWVNDPERRENYNRFGSAWRRPGLAEIGELNIPTLKMLLDLSSPTAGVGPGVEGYLDLGEPPTAVSWEGVPVRAYVAADMDRDGAELLTRAGEVPAMAVEEREEFVVGFVDAMADLLLGLARRRLVHNALLPTNLRVLDRTDEGRVALRLGPPGVPSAEMYGDQRPYLDWLAGALCMGLVGYGKADVDIPNLEASIDFGVGRSTRVRTGEGRRGRLLETAWADWFGDGATWYGPAELKDPVMALYAEASWAHGGLDLLVRIRQICAEWREDRHKAVDRLRRDLESLVLRCSGLAAEVEQGARASQRRDGELRENIDSGLASVLEGVGRRVDGLEAAHGALLAEHTARVDQLTSSVGAWERRLADAEADTFALKGTVGELGVGVDALAVRVEALEATPVPEPVPVEPSAWDTLLAWAVPAAGVLAASVVSGGALRWWWG